VTGDRKGQESEFRNWEAKCLSRLRRDSHKALAAYRLLPTAYPLLPAPVMAMRVDRLTWTFHMLTARREERVGDAHGGEDCPGVVHAHNVCAAQNGRDHRRGIADGERGGRAGNGPGADLSRFIGMRPCNRPESGPALLPRRRLKTFARDDGLQERLARAANEEGKTETLKSFEASEDFIVLPARFAEAQAGIKDDL